MLSGSFDSLDLDFEVLVQEAFSPAARSAVIAEFAREQLAEAESINQTALGFVPPHTTRVDGQPGASEDQVRPDGEIVYTFQLLPEIFAWIAEQLRAHAPVLTGRFRDSFEFYADGVLMDPHGEVPPAKQYVFISPLAYSHKLEEGASRMAPKGVFHAIATLADGRFGNQAEIGFVFDGRSLVGIDADPKTYPLPAISISLRG